MRASDEHTINLFNEFNKFSNEPARIQYSVYHIPRKELIIVKVDKFSLTRLLYNANVERAFDAMFVYRK